MKSSIVKSSVIVSLSILASRVLGLARDITIATLFGAGALTDAFFVAFRIPNLLRRIFAEGAFSSAFTPAFSRKLKVSRKSAETFAGQVLTVLLLSTATAVVTGEILAPLIIKVVAPGLDRELSALSVKLLREMLPYIFLVSLTAFFGGILNSFNHFFAPAFSTALFNLSVIALALVLAERMSVESLAVGVLAGGILQVALQIPFLRRFSFSPKPLRGMPEDVKETLKNILPGVVGFGARQLSMLIDTVLASFLKSGAISYLYYANRFVQLPLGMFAVGISQVLLPRLARLNGKRYEEELSTGIILCLAVVVPSSVGLILFGKPIVDLFFNHGAFSAEDLSGTYHVLWAYSVGLLAFSVEKIVVNAHYSLNEYRYPVVVSYATLLFNLPVNLLLCFVLGMGASGLALGTSLTSYLSTTFLLRSMRNRWNIQGVGRVIVTKTFSYLLASLPAGAVATIGAILYPYHGSTGAKLVAVGGTVLCAVAVYGLTLAVKKDPAIKLIRAREG